MKFSAKVRLGLVALVTAASAITMMPANADTGDAATIVGSGTISPGLTVGGGAQTFTFSGSGAGTISGETGQFSCSVGGNDTIGTAAQGAGGFSGTCNTPCGTVSVSGNYTRSVAAVSGGGKITTGCGTITAGHNVAINCVFVPTSAPVTNSYLLVCTIS